MALVARNRAAEGCYTRLVEIAERTDFESEKSVTTATSYALAHQAFLVLPYAHLFFAGILYYKLWSDRFTVGRSLLIAGCYLESIIGAPMLVVAIVSGIFILFSLCVAGYT